MHLVIVAGGLGSRLAPLTNYVPKFLVNIGKETGFVEQIRYWKHYNPQSITVIVHSSYERMVQAYFDLYFKNDPDLVVLADDSTFQAPSEEMKPTPFIVKTVDVANGSAHAIFSTCQHLDKQPVLFTWCDVLPGEHFDIEQLNHGGPFAFTNYDHPNRYDLVQTGKAWSHRELKIREDGRGGIFGIYYVSTYGEKPYEDGQDFADVLGKYSTNGYVNEVKIGKIIDWGDKPKLERTRSTADGARSFNSVEMHGDLVLKSALNLQGETLIAREIKWYDELDDIGSAVRRPQHWKSHDGKSFVMNKVNGVPIWTLWPTLDDAGREMVLKRLFEQLDLLHAERKFVGHDIVCRDIRLEALDKLLARHEEIDAVIQSFGPVQWVNGQQLLMPFKPRLVIAALYEKLIKFYEHEDRHRLIHGDLQMSNSMINPDTLEVTFIDPRGYFGKSDTFGVADYDIAKLLYSLSGYDLFNYSKDFHLMHNGLNIGRGQWEMNFTIPKPNLGGTGLLLRERFSEVHYLWLAVVWIGLAQYIKNDPVKSVAAHFHGLAMAERFLSGQFTTLIADGGNFITA
jgi:hypothetical protein